MPKGPKGEKRPADVIGAAVKVMRIATGEIEEDIAHKQPVEPLAASKRTDASCPPATAEYAPKSAFCVYYVLTEENWRLGGRR